MAVVSISRIQVRRGTINQGSGLPQLASGEFGWAIDSQELYIGNGSTSEGAPAVGNTQILTSNSNIIDLTGQYSYRADSNIQTSETDPVRRSIAARLDERVSIRSFGGATTTDQLQKALLELYLTDPSPNTAPVLHVEPGVYTLTRTVYVPPNTTIIGAGKTKTVFEKTGDFDMFRTIGTNVSYSGSLSSVTSIEVIAGSVAGSNSNRASDIRFENLTLKAIESLSVESFLLRLDNCSNSEFRSVQFVYDLTTSGTVSTTNSGIAFGGDNPATVSDYNKFVDCDFIGLNSAANGQGKSNNNEFVRCTFDQLNQGVLINEGNYNSISDSKFSNINKQAFLVNAGTGNQSKHNHYGMNLSLGQSIVKYVDRGNYSVDDIFERTYNFAISGNLNEKYYPEVEGPVFYTNGGNQRKVLTGNSNEVIRLPADTSKVYSIDYYFESTDATQSRSGNLEVLVNLATSIIEVNNNYSEVGTSVPGEVAFTVTGETQLDPTDASNIWAIRLLANSQSSGDLVIKITTKS